LTVLPSYKGSLGVFRQPRRSADAAAGRVAPFKVVAFEPLPSAFARLQQSHSAAWDGRIPPHVTLRREALVDRNRMTTISVPRINGVLQEEWASICKGYAALRDADPRIEAVETWSVPLLRLDDVGLTGTRSDAIAEMHSSI
jgi:hypothetical protein